MLGDMLECGGFLAQHHTLGYVAQMDELAYEDDVAAANWFLDEIARRAPGATIHYIEGNHEQRVERWCVTQGLTGRNAEYLRRAIGPEAVLRLTERGVKYYRQGVDYGAGALGVLKLGKVYFTHSRTTRKHAAAKMVSDFGGCVLYGNTHRQDFYPARPVAVGLVGAWCPGCLCQLHPYWNHDTPTSWTHGYALQIVDEQTGNHWTTLVPIDGGVSYLQSMVGLLG
jgi:hypothetical protein